MTGTDLAQAQSSLEQATAQRVTAEPARDQPGQLYPRRRPPTRPPDIAARAPGSARQPRGALTLAARSNPTVISAGFTELAARDNIDVVRGQLLPQVLATGDLDRAISAATSAGAITSGTTSTASITAAVRAAQFALAGLQEEALTGTRTVLDLLVGEQQLFNTQAQLVTAEHDTAIAEFNVAAAIGHLIAPELRLPVRLYEMGRHYKEVKDKWIGFAGGLKE